MFFLVPIGHEVNWVRRLPVVTFILIGLILGFYIVGRVFQLDHPRVSDADLKHLTDTLFAEPCAVLTDEDWYRLEREFPRFSPLLGSVRKQIKSIDELRWAACQARTGADPGNDKAAVLAAIRELVRHYGRTIYEIFGFVPARPTLWQAVTHMFVHAGFWHILGNLFFLWISSYALEDVWGRAVFLFLYLSSGLMSVFSFWLMNPHSTAVLVGASGAIAGLMGAFFLRMGHIRIRMALIYWLVLRGGIFQFWWKARWFLGFWFGKEVLSLLLSGSGAKVAYAAHVGGFLWGLAFAAFIRAAKIEDRVLAPRIERKLTETADLRLIEAGQALSDGDLFRARERIQAYLVAHRDDPDGWLLAFEIAQRMGDESLLKVAIQHLFHYAAQGDEVHLRTLVEQYAFLRERIRPRPAVRDLVGVYRRLRAEGRGHEALPLLEWVPDAENQVPPAFLMQWAQKYLEQGHFDKARALLQRTRDRWSVNPELIEMGRRLLQQASLGQDEPSHNAPGG